MVEISNQQSQTVITTELEELLTGVIRAALKEDGRHAEGDLSLVLTDDATIWALNQDYREKDAPTDVLSFSFLEGEGPHFAEEPLGEVYISVERALMQAEEYGHSLQRELCFLAVHGTLHVIGYDHMEEADEQVMFGLTEKILTDYGVRR